MLLRLFGTSGRITRQGFWLFVYFSIFLVVGLYIQNMLLFQDDLPTDIDVLEFKVTLQLFSIVTVSVIIFALFCTMGVRRFHDMNSSGIWVLSLPASIAVGALGGIAYTVFHLINAQGFGLIYLIQRLLFYTFIGVSSCLAVSAFFLILVLGLTPGTRGENKYGPDPLGKN
jgi:uncharacterized membrane protein YhaH (DUF805 family)